MKQYSLRQHEAILARKLLFQTQGNMTVLPNPYSAGRGAHHPGTAQHDNTCQVRVVTSTIEFDALEEEWRNLLEQSNATVFQSFEWLRSWWKHFAKPRYQLSIFLFYQDKKLIAIAPLFKDRMSFLGIRLATRLQFIGKGISDYVDFIIMPGYDQLVLVTFTAYLRATAKDWDIFDIEDVNENSLLVQHLPAIFDNHELNLVLYQGNVCPQIALPNSSESLMQGLGPTAGYNFRRKFKKLQQNFKSEIVLYQQETDDLPTAIDEFAEVHSARWKSLGHPSAFDNEKHKAFHLEFSRRFARRGWLRLYVMKVNDQATAIAFHFNYKKRIYMYQSNAFGSDDVMKCSPGFLLRSTTMVEGINEGMEVFDFLRGNESYKYKEFNAADSKNYLMRSTSSAMAASFRVLFYLTFELFVKMADRLRREYYEFRRYSITEDRTLVQKLGYVINQAGDLFILGYNFILRHVPVEAVQKLQVERQQHDTTEQKSESPEPQTKN